MGWQILIVSVAGANNALRVRLWRQLKAAGAAALRDGVYLLPDTAPTAVFQAWNDEIKHTDGEAYIVEVPAQPALDVAWQQLFDRNAEYLQWADELQAFLDAVAILSEPEARRGLRRFRKALDALAAADFFPSEGREQAERVFKQAQRQVVRHFSSDEPVPISEELDALDRNDFQGRLWATRARLWVDRVASAWLIRRFIDSNATFVWLTDIHACPAHALGFDFDGAMFTHVSDLVTFEVLIKRFGLDADRGLARLGAMVHALDLDGETPPEARGFEALLQGARARFNDDDALLDDISSVLDSLHIYFSSETSS